MDSVKGDQDDQLRFWLALYFATAASYAAFQKVKSHCQHPREVLDQPRLGTEILGAKWESYLRRPDWGQVDRHLEWQRQSSRHHILTIFHQAYPELLRQIARPPAVLFLRGNLDTLDQHCMAVVGSRNPSPAGRENAWRFASELRQAGFCVCSGLALGIDCASHRGALATNPTGSTIAVTATGIDRCYPHGNADLNREIADHGLVITEFPLGTSPRRDHFPRRNRIISGLSLGTLVVEATLRSGSLITARFAADQGREVFAIPGAIRENRASGCHYLIKQGAKLTESMTDILEEFPSFVPKNGQHTLNFISANSTDSAGPPAGLPEKASEVLENIGYAPTSIDEVLIRSGLTADTVSSMLLVLELQGYVSTSHGSYFRIR